LVAKRQWSRYKDICIEIEKKNCQNLATRQWRRYKDICIELEKKNKNWFWFDNLAKRQLSRYTDICIELEKKQKNGFGQCSTTLTKFYIDEVDDILY
jgi:hypothetical protein